MSDTLDPKIDGFKGDAPGDHQDSISHNAQPGTGQTADTVGAGHGNQPGTGTPVTDYDKGDASQDDSRPKQATKIANEDGRPAGGSGTGSGDGRPA